MTERIILRLLARKLTLGLFLGLLCTWSPSLFALDSLTISQTILFEYQVSEQNRYYMNGYRLDEFAATSTNGHSSYGQNYLVRSKTSVLHRYFAFIFEYDYSLNQINHFNAINSKLESQSTERKIHSIHPYLFGQFEPLRLGVSYLYRNNQSLLNGEQLWSLLKNGDLSLYAQLYFPELWENAPIGLSARYQFSFDPGDPDISSDLLHIISLGFHINFNYYGQFEILLSHLLDEEGYQLYRINEEGTLVTYQKNYRKRYYLDYIYTFQVLEEISLYFGIGQIVYSEYESPMMRFHFGVTYLLNIF